MTTQEETTYEVTVHLIDGKALKVSYPVTATELHAIYQTLGMDEGRIKFPTGPGTMHFMPTTSVLCIEAKVESE